MSFADEPDGLLPPTDVDRDVVRVVDHGRCASSGATVQGQADGFECVRVGGDLFPVEVGLRR